MVESVFCYPAEYFLNCLYSFPNSHCSGACVTRSALSFNSLVYILVNFISGELQLPMTSSVFYHSQRFGNTPLQNRVFSAALLVLNESGGND